MPLTGLAPKASAFIPFCRRLLCGVQCSAYQATVAVALCLGSIHPPSQSRGLRDRPPISASISQMTFANNYVIDFSSSLICKFYKFADRKRADKFRTLPTTQKWPLVSPTFALCQVALNTQNAQKPISESAIALLNAKDRAKRASLPHHRRRLPPSSRARRRYQNGTHQQMQPRGCSC
jgi:hypothetical protein